MEGLKDLLANAESLLKKQNDLVSSKLNEMNKDSSVSKEDKDFMNTINSQVNTAMKNQDVNSLNELMKKIQSKVQS